MSVFWRPSVALGVIAAAVSFAGSFAVLGKRGVVPGSAAGAVYLSAIAGGYSGLVLLVAMMAVAIWFRGPGREGLSS